MSLWDSMTEFFGVDEGFSAQDVADLDSPTGVGDASLVSADDPMLTGAYNYSMGMTKDNSWIETGLKAALAGMSRGMLGRHNNSRAGAPAPTGNVSANMSQQPVNEINHVMDSGSPNAGLSQWAKYFS